MIVLNSKNLIFIHIPKCGGTSVADALDPLLAWNDICIGGTRDGELLNATWAKRYRLNKHSTASEIEGVIGREAYARFSKFALVRHPVARFVSAIVFNRSRITAQERWIMPAATTLGLENYKDPEAMLDSSLLADVLRQPSHWASADFTNELDLQCRIVMRKFLPMRHFFGSSSIPDRDISIFKLEDAHHFSVFAESMGLDPGINLPRSNVTEGSEAAMAALSSSLRNRIENVYREDMEAFGY